MCIFIMIYWYDTGITYGFPQRHLCRNCQYQVPRCRLDHLYTSNVPAAARAPTCRANSHFTLNTCTQIRNIRFGELYPIHLVNGSNLATGDKTESQVSGNQSNMGWTPTVIAYSFKAMAVALFFHQVFTLQQSPTSPLRVAD